MKKSAFISCRIYYIICLIGFIAVFASCKKDWFNIKSAKNLTVPSTLQDFELLLDNFDAMTRGTPSLGEVASDGYYITDLAWTTTLQTDVPALINVKNAFTWSNDLPYTDVSDWNNSYKKVFNCNLVLDGLKKIPATDNLSQYNAIKGNALFIKAKTMFELAGIYAEPYLNNEDSPYGMILREGINISEKKLRSSVKDTYNAILADINLAVDLLPLKNTMLTRANKIACWALLARVYLNMGDYSRAHQFSDSVLRHHNDLLDFSSIPTPNSNLGVFNREVIFHSEMNVYLYIHPFYSRIDNELYDSYDVNDLRKELYFRLGAGGYVFKGTYNSTSLLFSGLATDEIYLIRAECFARENNIGKAMGDLNTLLRTRYKINIDGTTTYVDKTAGDETEALTVILTERRKELIRRGVRWTDLRRLNTDSRFQRTLHRSVGGLDFTLEPLNYRYTLPIPKDEMMQNNSLVQNPSWK